MTAASSTASRPRVTMGREGGENHAVSGRAAKHHRVACAIAG